MIRRIMLCSLVLLCLFDIDVMGQINHQVIFSSRMEIQEGMFDDGITYVQISVPETLLTDSVGYPALPVKYIKLIIPANADVSDVKVNATKKQKHMLKHLIKPLQEPIPISVNYKKTNFTKPDKGKYNSNLPYPSKLVEIVESGYFRGNHLVTLAIYPCQYTPKKNELDFFEKIEFTLNYTESSAKSKKRIKVKNNSKNKKILESLIENPTDIDKFSITEESSKDIPATKSLIGGGISIDCDYVVVTSQNLAHEFSEFIAWKRRKGVDIELVTIEDIKANYTGDNISGINDDAGKLRQFLADAYDNGNGIEYALLGGDNTIVPIRYAYYSENTTDENYIIPTDLYFSEFDGDWNVDGDIRYGEPSDNVDYYPEIYVGRVMVSNVDEVRNWTKKVLIYEQNPGNGDYSYLTKAFFTQADQLQSGNWAGVISNAATWLSSSTIWNESGGYNTTYVPSFPTGKNVIDEFNNHYGFTSFMAHGGATNVAVATKGLNDSGTNTKRKVTSFDNGYGGCCWIPETGNGFDNMNNVNYPSINYSISCETMPFDDFGTPVDDRNMGETYTCISDGGGSAYLGNTRYGWIPSSMILFEEFIDAITSNTSFNLGVVEAISKQTYNHTYLRYSHNLIGCPETEIWTGVPNLFTNVSIYRVMYGKLFVSTGVSNCTICVMSALDNGDSYYEVVEGVSSFTFPTPPNDYLVTITKHNYIPYLKNPDNIYIQNESIYSDKYIFGKYFYAGENVTTSKPQGPAKIKNGSNVVFDAINEVNLEGGFEVELGGEFEVKIND